MGVTAQLAYEINWLEGHQSPASRLKAFHVVLADFQGHHEWKALAILRIASGILVGLAEPTLSKCHFFPISRNYPNSGCVSGPKDGRRRNG
jgi:hypothetical protein